jgi:hypothetical protein
MRYHSLRQGLIGAWCPSLGATGYRLLDRSGYGNHGTLTNMDAGMDWVGRSVGTSLDFDGTNDFIDCGNSVNHQFSNSQNFSVSCWFVRRSSFPESALISCINSSDQGWSLSPSGNALRFPAYNTGPSVAILLNVVYHAVAVNRNGTRELYLNGVINDSNNGGFITAANINTVIGRYYSNLNAFYFNGWINDVRIYNRALTPAEIRLLASEPGIGLRPERVSVYFAESLSSRRRKILTGLT